MNRKLVITKIRDQIWTALFEDEEIVELHCSSKPSMLGGIYVGRVKNITNNIQAAFIEIADGVECYFPMEETGTLIFTQKIGKKPLCIGDECLVQVSKEAVKSKVPSVSSKLNFAGKYAVLTSGDTRVGVSSKLGREEKERLLAIAMPYASENYGFIIRTNAKDIAADALQSELERLIQEYESVLVASKTRACYSCLKASSKEYLTELRNIYQDGLKEILIEDVEIYEEVKNHLEEYQPEDVAKLRLYADKLLPLYKLYSMEKHIANAMKEQVWLKSGAYLIIQPTEALTVIDVNTGKCVSRKREEDTYLKINLEAAKEAARQIRLRNLSGIILVDFINLSNQEYMQELLKSFQRELLKDPIATTLVDVTKLQLVEVTRKKVRKPLHEAIHE